MPKAIYTPGAKQDLRQITRYIAQDNLPAAIEWLGRTRATCELLAAQPGIGQRVKTKRFTDAPSSRRQLPDLLQAHLGRRGNSNGRAWGT